MGLGRVGAVPSGVGKGGCSTSSDRFKQDFLLKDQITHGQVVRAQVVARKVMFSRRYCLCASMKSIDKVCVEHPLFFLSSSSLFFCAIYKYFYIKVHYKGRERRQQTKLLKIAKCAR